MSDIHVSHATHLGFEVQIDQEVFTLHEPETTGRQLLALVKRDPADFYLVFPIKGQVAEAVELDEPFSLAAPGTERLILVSRSRHFAIRIDETDYNAVGPLITGRQLLALARKDPETHTISLSRIGQDDPFIDPDERIDLSAPGREQFYVEVKKPLAIVIDEVSYHPGKQEMTGTELRALSNPSIAPTRDLWLDVPGKDDHKVADAETVRLKDGMVFYTAPSTINPGGEGGVR